MSKPVTPERVAIAEHAGLANVATAAVACRDAGLPFWAACALLEKESGGRNVYGHDQGGVHSLPNGRALEVTPVNYHDFIIKVMNGATSNGVGPCQITYAGTLVRCTGGNGRNGGYFRLMAEAGLLPWRVYDNMLFGFRNLGRLPHQPRHLVCGCAALQRRIGLRARLREGRKRVAGTPVNQGRARGVGA